MTSGLHNYLPVRCHTCNSVMRQGMKDDYIEGVYFDKKSPVMVLREIGKVKSYS